MAITQHHDIAVTASLIQLCSLGVAFCGVKLRSFKLGGESLEVGINDERGRQLLVVALKGELFLPFSASPPGLQSAQSLDSWDCGHTADPCVAVQAALTEVLAFLVLWSQR